MSKAFWGWYMEQGLGAGQRGGTIWSEVKSSSLELLRWSSRCGRAIFPGEMSIYVQFPVYREGLGELSQGRRGSLFHMRPLSHPQASLADRHHHSRETASWGSFMCPLNLDGERARGDGEARGEICFCISSEEALALPLDLQGSRHIVAIHVV